MSEAKYTPAPWRATWIDDTEDNNARFLISVRFPGQEVRMVEMDGRDYVREMEGNERLTEAAPDLLAELQSSVKMMVNALDNMAYLFPAKDDEARAWRNMLKTKVREARAAIAKATEANK
jgi:hypothetical protein